MLANIALTLFLIYLTITATAFSMFLAGSWGGGRGRNNEVAAAYAFIQGLIFFAAGTIFIYRIWA